MGDCNRCPICEALPNWPHADWCEFKMALPFEPPARYRIKSIGTGGSVDVTGETDLCAAMVRMVTSGHKVEIELIPARWRVYWGNIETHHADFYDVASAVRLQNALLVLRYGNVSLEELK